MKIPKKIIKINKTKILIILNITYKSLINKLYD